MKGERQVRSQLAAAQELGEAKGREEGMKGGREEVMAEMCARLLEMRLPKETVAQAAGLTLSELDNLLQYDQKLD